MFDPTNLADDDSKKVEQSKFDGLTNALSQKLSLFGGTVSGNFNVNQRPLINAVLKDQDGNVFDACRSNLSRYNK